MKSKRLIGLGFAAACLPAMAGASDAPAERHLLWGDTHLHTSYSFDAFLNGNRTADPETAYRYARGYPVIHPYNRTRVQIETPLDFLVVSDHAEFYGGIRDIYNDGIQDPDPNVIESLVYWYRENEIRDAIDSGNGAAYFASLLPQFEDPREAAARWVEDNSAAAPPGADISAANAWHRMLEYAAKYDEPGTFTALLGWEWSTIPGGANLHRVVLTDADYETAREFMPFASTDSPFPEDLWDWMDATGERIGARFVAIPHNSNISRGTMFSRTTMRGNPVDRDYAEKRRRLEPIVEITQIKGDSETHPRLSPDDPFADFELYPWYILQRPTRDYTAMRADYVRTALMTGLELDAELGVNPFEFGVIGSTDSHSGLASAEEPNFWGKMAFDSIPENKRGRRPAAGPTGWSMQAAGLAAVWADSNTREGIVDAFMRRETYATTGSRIRLRVFAGYGFGSEDVAATGFVRIGYAGGVPMGGTLERDRDDRAPVLIMRAERDPASAALDRLQVVKGWLDADGQSRERVFDVAWAGERKADADGRVPAIPSTVDLTTGAWDDSVGAPELAAHWVDPSFDPDQRAFYYVRVLEIPTPRHAQLDAIALGLDAPAEGPQTIQERAYGSPIWYQPGD